MYFWQKLEQVEKEYIEFLHRTGCIKVGERERFVLKSGRKSNYFFDVQEGFDNTFLSVIGKTYASKMIRDLPPDSFDLVVGPSEKGTAIGIATVMNLPSEYGRISVFWDRKLAKEYGINKRASWTVGPYEQLKQLVRTRSVIRSLIVDDVITTGKAKRETMSKFEGEVETLRQELTLDNPVNVQWVKIYIAVNRRETDEQGRNPIEVFQTELGTPIDWITDSYNIFGHLHESGVIARENVADFVAYQEQYGLSEDRERLEELRNLVQS